MFGEESSCWFLRDFGECGWGSISRCTVCDHTHPRCEITFLVYLISANSSFLAADLELHEARYLFVNKVAPQRPRVDTPPVDPDSAVAAAEERQPCTPQLTETEPVCPTVLVNDICTWTVVG